MASFLERLAQAYMEKERHRLGIPEQERAAAESQMAQEAARQLAAMNALKIRGAESELAYGPTKRKMAEEESAARVFNLREPNRLPPQPHADQTETQVLKNGNIGVVNRTTGVVRDTGVKAYIKPTGGDSVIIWTKEGPMRVPKAGGPATPVTGIGGEPIEPAATAEQRNVAYRQKKTANSLKALDVLGEQLITERSVLSQRAGMTAEAIKAQTTSSPKYRAYQDARRAMAINLAAIMNQGRPTEPDAVAAGRIIPDVFSDTTESAAIKRDLIQQMLSSPDEARDMLVEFEMKYGGKGASEERPIDVPSMEHTLGGGRPAPTNAIEYVRDAFGNLVRKK